MSEHSNRPEVPEDAMTPEQPTNQPRQTVHTGHDESLLPERGSDDRDEVWGDRVDSDEDDALLRERPPHWHE